MIDNPLTLDIHNRVATLRLNRAAKRNAFSLQMWRQLCAALTEVADDHSVNSLVLCSAIPGIFCAGADINEFDQFIDSPELADDNARAIRQAADQLQCLKIPTLALIDGDTFGAGCLLALACDFRFASPRSRFAITPARLGLTYARRDVNTLVHCVGLRNARRLLLNVETFDADCAQQTGLVDQLIDSSTLDRAAAQWCQHIDRLAPHALSGLKAHLLDIMLGSHDDDKASLAAFSAAFQSAELKVGRQAFLAKQPAQFPGRKT